MASGGIPYEEHFCCCICLDLFTNPVTLPCGHNFCKGCISQHWSCSRSFQCALCKENFGPNTELRVNTMLSQMSQQLRSSGLGLVRLGGEGDTEKGEVQCDVCSTRRAKKSCVNCLTSFCETHLEPHYRIAGLKRHQLIEPVGDLEQRTCEKHNRPLRFFCQTDQTCVCKFCSESDHSRHSVVSLEQGGAETRQELSKLQDRIVDMALERRIKIDKLKQAGRNGEDKMAENIRDSVQAVFKVKRSLEKGLCQLLGTIESKQKEEQARTTGFVLKLEDEICELMNARIHLEEHKSTNDDFKLIQKFESLKILPKTQDLSVVDVRTFQQDIVKDVMKKMKETAEYLDRFWTEVELRCAQQFAADVTLDSKSASPALILSDDCKQVKCVDVKNKIRGKTHRFAEKGTVLGKQFVDSGKFYFEVKVGGKASWDLGVVFESIDRKQLHKFGLETGSWVIWHRNGRDYYTMANLAFVNLYPRSKPQKIGVFVDYDEGVVSFYNSETTEKIYSFEKCEFEERLYPYFSPGEGDGQPLIITAVVPCKGGMTMHCA